MTDIVARLRRLEKAWKNDPHGVDYAFGQAADEIERMRTALLEAHVLLQTWVNVSADMSADPLLKPLRDVQNSEQELLIRAQEWCRRVGPVTPAEASRFRTTADEIERLRAALALLLDFHNEGRIPTREALNKAEAALGENI